MKTKDQKSLELLYESMDEESVMIPDQKGTQYWKNKKGQLHRLDGPAVVWRNGKGEEWWVNGELHRLDGPALDYLDVKDWYVRGAIMDSEEEFNNHPLVKAYKLKEKLKNRSSSEEEGVMADMFV